MRDAAQMFAHDGRLTDDKHFRGIAVETIFDYGDINVNDIAIFQQLSIVRDTVAHHFINRDANGFRIAVIAEAGRNRVLFINNVIITDAIQPLILSISVGDTDNIYVSAVNGITPGQIENHSEFRQTCH